MIKKLITNLAIVIIVVLVLDFAIGRTLRYFYFKETSGFHFRTSYAMESATDEILIFGSSRANHHYVPEVLQDSLKMSLYNTGRDGNGILFQMALLQSVLKRYVPKLIILDFFEDIGKNRKDYDRLAALLPYYRTHEEVRKTIGLRSSFEKIKLFSEIYPFNSQILSIAIGNLEMNKDRFTDIKGYVPLTGELQDNIPVVNEQKFEVDSVKLNAFREFICLAKESDTKIVVIYSPIFRNYEKNPETEICSRICKEENVPYWDFSKDTLFLNHNHLFRDIYHLNFTGAKIFSELIVEKIKLDPSLTRDTIAIRN
jgi:hypothetical protein